MRTWEEGVGWIVQGSNWGADGMVYLTDGSWILLTPHPHDLIAETAGEGEGPLWIFCFN